MSPVLSTHFSKQSSFRALAVAGVATMSAVAASAQVGTYRPAVPISVSPATAPDQCVQHCAGDAGCRAWNFVTLGAGEGVCEFLDRNVAPIASRVSTSGAAPGLDPASHRILPAGTPNTTRIGSPAPVRIRREAPPQRRQAQPARALNPVAPRAAAPQAQHQPRPQARVAPTTQFPARLMHSLDDAPRAARPAPAPAVAPQPRPAAKPAAPVSAADMARAQARGMGPAQAQVQAPVQAPIAAPAPAMAQAHAPTPAPAAAPVEGPFIPASQSDALFGNLYDDVAMPAPASASDLEDGEAPVATTTRIQVAPLPPAQPAPVKANLKGLAGG